MGRPLAAAAGVCVLIALAGCSAPEDPAVTADREARQRDRESLHPDGAPAPAVGDVAPSPLPDEGTGRVQPAAPEPTPELAARVYAERVTNWDGRRVVPHFLALAAKATGQARDDAIVTARSARNDPGVRAAGLRSRGRVERLELRTEGSARIAELRVRERQTNRDGTLAGRPVTRTYRALLRPVDGGWRVAEWESPHG